MIIINTETFEDFVDVLEWASDQNMIWQNGYKSKSIHEEYWKTYRSRTCLVIRDKVLSYCPTGYAVDNYTTSILSMEQFRKNNREYYSNRFERKFGLR